MSEGVVHGDHLGLRRAVGHARLSFANPRNGKATIGPAQREMQTGSGPLRVRASGEVRVHEEVWLQVHRHVPDPAHHAVMVGGVDVTDKLVKPSVTLGRPFREETRQVADGAQ